MRILVILLLVCLSTAATAQNPQIILVNSGELIKKSISLRNEDKKDQALLELDKISKSDTNYALSIYHKSLTLLMSAKHKETQEVCKFGLNLNSKYEASFFLFLAASYDDSGQKELAIETYKKGLEKYPYDYSLLTSMGMTYLNLWKINEAVECFQKSININFFNALSHKMLGHLCLIQNQPTRGTLSILTYLTLEPQDDNADNVIIELEKYLSTNVAFNNDSLLIQTAEDFQTTDLVLNSQVTFNKNFKLKSELDYKVVRQCQALLEKLEYAEESEDFWMKNYVLFYKRIWENGLFNDFTHYWLSSVNEKAKKRYEKNDAGIKKAKELVDNSFSEHDKLKVLDFNGKTAKYFVGTYNNHNLQAITTKYDESTKTLMGYTEFFHPNKSLMSKGLYDDNGQKTGEWKYYTEEGFLSQISVFNPKDSTVKFKDYFPNGNLEVEGQYKNDLEQGEFIYYYLGGGKKYVKVFEKGQKEGKFFDYHQNGQLAADAIYKNNELDGPSRQYYYNGQLSSESTYSKGLEEGDYKSYFFNGKPKVAGKMSNNLLQGEWLYFDINGKKIAQSIYKDSKKEGKQSTFHSNGKLASEGNSTDGEPVGLHKYFDEDGLIFAEEFYEKKLLKYTKIFDKKGNIIKENTRKNDQLVYETYYPAGQKRQEGSMNKFGNNGSMKEYYMSGALFAERQYKDGLLHGISKEFTELGQLKMEGFFKDNQRDGYFVYYHDNGQKSYEGWYVNDLAEGQWKYYYNNGVIKDVMFFQNGIATGYAENYAPTGVKLYEYFTKDNIVTKTTQYDTLGQVFNTIDLPKANGKVTILSLNKKPYKEYTLVNGVKQGKETYYWSKDGNKYAEVAYNNDMMDGKYMSYHHNGKLKNEIEYKNGLQDGYDKRYFDNGKLEYEGKNIEGEADGESQWYYHNGALETVTPLKKDEKNGELIHFGEDGKTPAYKIIYVQGHIVGYSYQDKNAQWLPVINTKNGTFDIKAYYPNGKMSYQASYKNNQRMGNLKRYYMNGNLSAEYNFVNGMYHGEQKVFYVNGKIRNRYFQKEDEHEGPSYSYTETGKLVLEEHYLQGYYHGKVIEYDANEKVAKSRNFYFGIEY
jgi:uncharacterized protein